jgi:hypothetical protein
MYSISTAYTAIAWTRTTPREFRQEVPLSSLHLTIAGPDESPHSAIDLEFTPRAGKKTSNMSRTI